MAVETQVVPAPVAEALDRAAELGEIGFQVAAYLRGELIVDAWFGRTAEEGGEPVDGQTLFSVFSVTKAITATAVHIQAERGLIDYDTPIAHYWPEYAANGKAGVTVRHVLTHRSGVPQMPPDTTPELITDWHATVSRIAELEALHEPGTRNAYLPMSFGWHLGEVVRRTDPKARPFGQFVREEICEPLRMDSFFLGIPPEVEPRVATLVYPDAPGPAAEGTLRRLAVPASTPLIPELYNRSEIRRACLPGTGGISNARSVARFFAMLANGGELDGVRLLSRERVESFLVPRPDFDSIDETNLSHAPVGMGGMWIEGKGVPSNVPSGRRVLCHPGVGQSIGWADLDTGLAFAVCHNRCIGLVDESPVTVVADAVVVAAGS